MRYEYIAAWGFYQKTPARLISVVILSRLQVKPSPTLWIEFPYLFFKFLFVHVGSLQSINVCSSNTQEFGYFLGTEPDGI